MMEDLFSTILFKEDRWKNLHHQLDLYLYQIFDVDLDPKISTLEIKYKKSGLFSIYFSDWHDLVTN
jgi:hypothetical protein